MASSPQIGVFGTMTRTNTLLVLHLLKESHASEIAGVLEISLSQVQKALDGLEVAGLVVGTRVGRERRVKVSPRFPHRHELLALLDKMTIQDLALHERLATKRRRPRRAGKAI